MRAGPPWQMFCPLSWLWFRDNGPQLQITIDTCRLIGSASCSGANILINIVRTVNKLFLCQAFPAGEECKWLRTENEIVVGISMFMIRSYKFLSSHEAYFLKNLTVILFRYISQTCGYNLARQMPITRAEGSYKASDG